MKKDSLRIHLKQNSPILSTNTIFKLADRMRSMRTDGASKNRDYTDQMGPLTFYGMYKYLWYV